VPRLMGEPRQAIAVANGLLLTDADDGNWELPPDPALESWANFEVYAVSRLTGSGSSNYDESIVGGAWVADGRNGYDGGTHEYDPQYINPASHELRLDASLGMNLNRPEPVAMRVGVRGRARTLGQFRNLIEGDGDGPRDVGDGDGAGPVVPDSVTALRWLIRNADGWSARWLNMRPRPVAPMQNATFRLPTPGAYDVTLRVHFANGSVAERTVHVELREWFIASIGDSLPAGQGNPDMDGEIEGGLFDPLNPLSRGSRAQRICNNPTASMPAGLEPPMERPSVWTEPMAHRSMRSGPALAALALQNVSGATRTRAGRQVDRIALDKVVFVTLARTGAEVEAGLFDPQRGDPDFIGLGQIDELERTADGRRIDALIISIGGNDAGFASVLEGLVFPGFSVIGVVADDDIERAATTQRLNEFLAGELPDRYDALRDRVEQLRERIGLREVYWTGYPTGLFDTGGDLRRAEQPGFDACGLFTGPGLSIDSDDNDVIRDAGQALNAVIRRKAREFGWNFVPLADDFRGHGYCESDDQRYWVQAEESCRRQGDFLGTMHPNARGHEAYGNRLYQAILRRSFNLGDPRPDARQQVATR
jgi:lysophospholipase L1-like esterase